MTELEKEVLKKFLATKFPEHYKLDATDNILFLEYLNFDLCPCLLNRKPISRKTINYLLKQYSAFLAQTDVSEYDRDLIAYLSLVNNVVGIALNRLYRSVKQ